MTDTILLMNSSSFAATRGAGGSGGAGGSYDRAGGRRNTVLGTSSADERLVAQAALDAAEEQLQSLCASYAGTFVSVEKRGRAVEQALQQVQRTIQTTVETKLVAARRALEQPEEEDDDDEDDDGGGGDDDDDTNTNNNNNNKNRSATPGDSEQDHPSASAAAAAAASSVSLAVLSERHRVRRRTLLQHSSLLELLELPSLMDACVRSSLYDEALSIAAFANTLERRHPCSASASASAGAGASASASGASASLDVVTNTTTAGNKHAAVVTRVIAQIRSRQGDLQRHLLHRLTGTVTMPQCLEVVTALRRLNSIVLEQQQQLSPVGSSGTSGTMVEQWHEAMELRLQIDFLEARDAWLDSSLASPTATTATTTTTTIMSPPLASSRGIPTAAAASSSSEQLLDTIERYRTRVFEVATQYNAIFRAHPTHSATTSSSSPTSRRTDSSMALLSMWTARRVSSFLTLLSMQWAAEPDVATLRDALDASLFFASSMGRLGADFTPQLAPIVQEPLHRLVVRFWNDGAHQLAETLKLCREAGVASPLVSSASSTDAGSSEDVLAKATDETSGDATEPQPPPRVLLTAPPLARWVNAILTGLNELRRCLLPTIFTRLRQSLTDVIDATRQELIAQERAVMAPGFRGQAKALREIAVRYRTLFDTLVEPYVRGSLEAALGNQEQAMHFHQILRTNMVVKETNDGDDDDGKDQQPEAEKAPAGEGDQPAASTETANEETVHEATKPNKNEETEPLEQPNEETEPETTND